MIVIIYNQCATGLTLDPNHSNTFYTAAHPIFLKQLISTWRKEKLSTLLISDLSQDIYMTLTHSQTFYDWIPQFWSMPEIWTQLMVRQYHIQIWVKYLRNLSLFCKITSFFNLLVFLIVYFSPSNQVIMKSSKVKWGQIFYFTFSPSVPLSAWLASAMAFS